MKALLTDAEIDARLERLRQLDDEQKRALLMFLDGFAPDAVDVGLDELNRQATQ